LKFLTSGKVKDLYNVNESTLLFKFSDRVSAYDVKFKQDIPRKGEILCKFAEFWFNKLPVPNHFVRRESDTEIIVKKMKMLPMECVVRGYFYGSLAKRWEKGEVMVLQVRIPLLLQNSQNQFLILPQNQNTTFQLTKKKHWR